MESGRWWLLAGALSIVQGWLGWAAASRARSEHTTYVFTPLVDVVPGGVPLGAAEAAGLLVDLRHQAEARDMQSAYARLGSTMALDDLLRGVEGLEAAGVPLQGAALERVQEVLTRAQADHAEILKVQSGILDEEAEIGRGVAAVLASLPEETRARLAGAPLAPAGRAPAGRAPGGGPPMGGPPGVAPPRGAR